MKRLVLIVLAAATVAALAQQNLPEPQPVENKQLFQPATAPSSPLPAAAPKPKRPAPLSPRDAADALSADELKDVLEALEGNYVRPQEIAPLALERARMEGILTRLGNGARIFPAAQPVEKENQPFRAVTIEDGTAYIRLGTLSTAAVNSLDDALDSFSVKPPGALILDLRATPPHADFEEAAEVCRRFCPKGRILFSIKRTLANDEEILTSRVDPRWSGILVVLVDSDTAGSGEVVAAVLRTHLGAYIIGQRTRGEAAQFEQVHLGKDRVLKVAIGEVTLPDATPVFPGGLTPDLAVAIPQEKTDELLTAALTEKNLASFVAETERPRRNEAALVAGTNPEVDAIQRQQALKSKGEKPPEPLRDTVLQRAMDFITTIRIAEAPKRK